MARFLIAAQYRRFTLSTMDLTNTLKSAWAMCVRNKDSRESMVSHSALRLMAWLPAILLLSLIHQANAQSESLAAELRQNTQKLLDAIAPGDVAVWDKLLDDQMLQVDENNVVRNKAQILKELIPLGPGLVGNLQIDDFRIVHRGRVAVVTHEDNEYLNYHGQVIRSRFRNTDTWIQTPHGWRLLGSQVLAVLKDPDPLPNQSLNLCQYAGIYQLTAEISGSYRCEGDELLFERDGKAPRHFRAEVSDVFFEPGQPRSRRIFVRDAKGTITGFVDRREARDIAWTRLPKSTSQSSAP
jgi:Domain of unknown function (DUF4440)